MFMHDEIRESKRINDRCPMLPREYDESVDESIEYKKTTTKKQNKTEKANKQTKTQSIAIDLKLSQVLNCKIVTLYLFMSWSDYLIPSFKCFII